MYQAVLTERFKATHALDTLRPQPHEHEWIIRVTVASDTLETPGIIINYFDLKPMVYQLLPHGKHLNDVYDFAPTGENLARHFYDTLKPGLPQLLQVSVGEFEDFMCVYAP